MWGLVRGGVVGMWGLGMMCHGLRAGVWVVKPLSSWYTWGGGE